MISAKLSGGDCLNAGCVPSKALLRAARLVREVRLAVKDRNFGVMIGGEGIGSEGGGVSVDFPRIMERMRRLRAEIAPVDGHARGSDLGVQTFQGFGRFVSPDTLELECECLLVATGRSPNVEGMGLEAANVDYDPKRGILIDDNARSPGNPNVYAVGDCCAGVPRLTHVSGEMAKVVVQNALFQDSWKVSSLVIPACMYTEPEYATAGLSTAPDDEVDTYMTTLEHNDRAILDGDNHHGFVKILCKKGTGSIVGCTIVAARAGEMINEVTLAMKNDIGLEGIGRNIHAYPTTGEAIMMCGLQLINSKWKRLDDDA